MAICGFKGCQLTLSRGAYDDDGDCLVHGPRHIGGEPLGIPTRDATHTYKKTLKVCRLCGAEVFDRTICNSCRYAREREQRQGGHNPASEIVIQPSTRSTVRAEV